MSGLNQEVDFKRQDMESNCRIIDANLKELSKLFKPEDIKGKEFTDDQNSTAYILKEQCSKLENRADISKLFKGDEHIESQVGNLQQKEALNEINPDLAKELRPSEKMLKSISGKFDNAKNSAKIINEGIKAAEAYSKLPRSRDLKNPVSRIANNVRKAFYKAKMKSAFDEVEKVSKNDNDNPFKAVENLSKIEHEGKNFYKALKIESKKMVEIDYFLKGGKESKQEDSPAPRAPGGSPKS